MSDKAAVMRMLAEMAKLSILAEGSPQSFKVRAYENAIHGLEGHNGDLRGLSKSDLTEIKGVGGSIADKILEFLDTGTVAKLEELRRQFPPPFVELTRIPGLGPKTLKAIRAELGVEDLDGLRDAIANERLRDLPGLGKTSEEKIAKAIERLGLHGKDRRTPIADAWGMARSLTSQLEDLDGVVASLPCGSLRRFSETIGDIDIVVATTDPGRVSGFVAGHPDAAEVIGSGPTKTSIVTRDGLQIDVRTVTPAQFGAAILYFTGSKSHNIALRQIAIDRGWLLNEYGLFEEDKLLASETEEEIYRRLGLDPIPPPLREGSGEIEAAAAGELPRLIERGDIRGDLHYHSDRSGDGRASLEEMVKAAVSAGYEYVAFTDHGENLTINGSTRDQMLAHRDQIRELQELHPEITILFGCELNIGHDGSLDYDHGFRMEFDYCVASVHSHFDLDRDKQTARVLKALGDSAVNALGHLTGRKIGRRPGIEIDIDVVLEALEVTGVALEVNGALDRLDASAEVVREAVGRGVNLVIDTDSHHPVDLVRMDYGVENARRGWAPRDLVLNARPLEELMAWVGRRRD